MGNIAITHVRQIHKRRGFNPCANANYGIFYDLLYLIQQFYFERNLLPKFRNNITQCKTEI